MPAYVYPIKINREKQIINYTEEVWIESGCLKLSDLAFVGSDSFSIADAGEWENGYIISVMRSRLETDEEQATRVAREEAYMVEYEKRRPQREALKEAQKEKREKLKHWNPFASPFAD